MLPGEVEHLLPLLGRQPAPDVPCGQREAERACAPKQEAGSSHAPILPQGSRPLLTHMVSAGRCRRTPGGAGRPDNGAASGASVNRRGHGRFRGPCRCPSRCRARRRLRLRHLRGLMPVRRRGRAQPRSPLLGLTEARRRPSPSACHGPWPCRCPCSCRSRARSTRRARAKAPRLRALPARAPTRGPRAVPSPSVRAQEPV